MDRMTPRQRMMIALKGGTPDRVPAAPDISNMIPCRLTGKPFWEIYVNQNPPLWKAYIDAIKQFGIDGWFTYGDLQFKQKEEFTVEWKVDKKHADRWEGSAVYTTPAGELRDISVFPVDNSPTHIEKMIKDFEKDFPKYKYLYPEITGYEGTTFKEQKKELGENGIMAVCIMPPGLHIYVEHFNGSLEAATYAYYDYPDEFEELRQLHEKYSLRQLELAIDAGVDSILTGGSGSITLQSPEIWRKMALPTLKKITKMCKEAGVITGIHSCGKEMYIVEACANEMDLDYINPLEIAPMGDCTLAECKEKAGKKLALMGNLHTTDVMLCGTSEKVKLECLKAIRDAGQGGGFVLSTGDQCGRETPDENIAAMVNTAKEYGTYPLNIDKINTEIYKLELLVKG